MIRHCPQRLILCFGVSRGGSFSSFPLRRRAAASLSCAHHLLSTSPYHNFGQHRRVQSDATTAVNSNRSSFKTTPIIPSILSYIEKIGVGIRPKPTRKKRRSSKGVRGGNDNSTLDEVEEREYFRQNNRMAPRQQSDSSQRNMNKTSMKRQNKNSNHQDGKKEDKAGVDGSSSSKVGAHWLPPPPFSTYAKGNGASTTRQRRPVKVLGSAASLNDELPRESNLAEVALAGRSNVGKSTLLNALLYGNIDATLSPRKFQRGRTPEGAKLPKGAKAITSDKPGETKRMSFYQLTADVNVADNEEVKGRLEASNEDGAAIEAIRKSEQHLKYSLVLVDLPGFGFAFAKDEKAKEWNDLMHHYLLERKTLKRILLLLDARHGFKLADFEFLEALQEGLKQQNSSIEEDSGGRRKKKRRELPPIQIVLTKCDLVKQADLARRVVVVRQQLSDALAREPSSLPVMLVSARAGLGFNNIRGAEQQPMGGVLELQRELASLVPVSKVARKK